MDRNVIEEIKRKVNLKEFIQSRGVELNERGKGLCPLHNETNPSFEVVEKGDKSFFYCHGCHQGGDVFRFIELHEGVKFGEALKKVAIYNGIDLEPYFNSNDLGKSVQDRLRRKKIAATLDAAASFYQEQITSDVTDYLHERGLTDKTIKDFRIGYAPSNLTQFIDYLTRQGFNKKDMVDAGLIRVIHDPKTNEPALGLVS